MYDSRNLHHTMQAGISREDHRRCRRAQISPTLPSISHREAFCKFDTVDRESLVVPSESLFLLDEESDKARVKRALATDLLPEARHQNRTIRCPRTDRFWLNRSASLPDKQPHSSHTPPMVCRSVWWLNVKKNSLPVFLLRLRR
jgi:hypothetical protein